MSQNNRPLAGWWFLLLLVTLLSDGAITSAYAQDDPVEPAGVELAAIAAAVDANPSPSFPVSAAITTAGAVRAATRAGRNRDRLLDRTPMLTSLDAASRTLSFEELVATQGAAVDARPAFVPGSDVPQQDGTITAQGSGTSGASYSDSRFGLNGTEYTSIASKRVGRLLVTFNQQTYLCTASVIQKALLVTAAHCVFNYGQKSLGYPDTVNGQLQVWFEPGLDQTTAPSGTWWAERVMVLQPYFDGTDTNGGTAGVNVNNDVALVWLKPLNGQQIGDAAGWLGYGYNAWGFTAAASGLGLPTAPASSQLTQFGYPGGFDGGSRMQIGNGASYVMASSNTNFKNIIRGTSMTGGSSGGPWIANYGVDATVTDTTKGNYGQYATRNVVMGVTSWGYTNVAIKLQGASYFGANREFPSTYGTRGAGNIAKLLYDACDNTCTNCWQLKSKSLCT